MPEESDSDKTVVYTRLRKVIPNETHLRQINDAVIRVHRITMDATELVAHHVTRCLNQDLVLPVFDADYMKMVMMEVSHGRGRFFLYDLIKTHNDPLHFLTHIWCRDIRESLPDRMLPKVTAYT